MCGIFSIFSKTEIDKNQALAQLKLIEHRGPDSSDFYQDSHCFIGSYTETFLF